jgi:hypothetical protein
MKMFRNFCYVLSIGIAVGIGSNVCLTRVVDVYETGGEVNCTDKELSNPCQLGSTECPGSYTYKGVGTTAYMVKLTVSDMMKQCYQSNATCILHDVYSVDTHCE